MARSQNGWGVLTEAPPAVVVPGAPTVKLRLRPGNVAYLLVRVAAWVHENVERLDKPVVEGGKLLPTDDWGWANRNVRESDTQVSNHASGTAEDLNATEHPRGVKRTWTQAEIAKINAHLREYEGTVRWGELYSTTIDGMHFEINRDADEVARVASKLRALDAERARAEEEVMATADEVAKATISVPMPLMNYVDQLYNDADGKMSLGEAVQHAAGQSYAANSTAGRALGEAQAARRDIAALTAQVTELVRVVGELGANTTPPASGAGG